MKIFTQSATSFSGNSFNRFAGALAFLLILLNSGIMNAQTTANYAGTTNATSSLATMTGSAQLVAASQDDTASSVTNIGFDFWFMGTRYTQFSANSNGLIQLGSTVVGTSANVQIGNTSATGLLSPFSFDMATGSSGKVHYLLSGTAPNRVLTIEWVNMLIGWNAGTADGQFQAQLSEATGAINYIYGSMVYRYAPTTTTVSIGIQSSSTATTNKTVNENTNAFSATAGGTSYSLGTTVPTTMQVSSSAQGSRRSYIFTPAATTTPGALSFTNVTSTTYTINWADNASDEVGYAVYYSTDGGTTYTWLSTTAANATTQGVTGLTTGATYLWKVYPVREALGTASSGSYATPATYTSIVSGGVWNTAATWSVSTGGTGVPTAGSIVVVNTNVTASATPTNQPSSITINNGFTLTLNAAYTNPSTGTITVSSGGTLALGGTLTNSGTTNINGGTLQLNSSGSITGTAPLYAASSLLKYNTGANPQGRGIEWGINAAGTSGTTAGYPFNVQLSNNTTFNYPNSSPYTANKIAGSLTVDSGSNFYMDYGSPASNGSLTVAANVIFNGNVSLGNQSGGDLNVGGNWTRTAATSTFNANNRAVTFNGSGTQVIALAVAGTQSFPFLITAGSGTVQLSSSPATSVTVTGSNGLTLGSSNATSTIDLNGQTLTLNGGGNLSVGTATRNITSTTGTGTLAITTSGLTVTNTAPGKLITGNNVLVALSTSLNFGSGITTIGGGISGTLQLNSGYGVSNSPFYAAGSLLQYNSSGSPARSSEWTLNSTGTSGTTAGYPFNVQLSGATTLNYPNGSYTANKIAGALTIDANSNLYMDFGSPGANGSLTVAGNVTLNGNLSLGNQLGGDFNVGGNWTYNTGSTLNMNGRAVSFNGGAAQTIGGSANTPFAYLTIANTVGGVSLTKPATVANVLNLTSGVLTTTATNTLTINNTANTAITGGSSTSFVNGPLTWAFPNSSSANYIFPIGASATYLPFAITNPGGTSPVVTMQAFGADAGAGATFDSSLVSISHTEYWLGTFSGTLSAGTVSAAKASLGSTNSIAQSAAQTGTYAGLGGATNNSLITSNTVTSSTGAGSSLGYFVLGTVVTPYYYGNSITTDITNANAWWSTADGTGLGTGGSHPSAVTVGSSSFNIQNTTTVPTMSTTLTLGAGSKFVVGGGSSAATFSISSTLTGTVDVTGNGTLNINVATVPTFGTLNATSTVNYSGTGVTNTITATNYGNLGLSGTGTRTFPSGTVGIAGTFSTGTFTTAGGTGTINFSSAGSQTIPAFIYNNLTNTGNGARTLANSGTVGIAGTTFTTGTGVYTVTGSTVDFSNATGLTIPIPTPAATNNYNNLTISGAGSYALASSTTISGNFSQTAGTFIVTPAAVANTFTVGGTFTQAGSFNVTGSTATAGATVAVTGVTTINGSFAMEANSSNTTSTVLFQANSDATFGTAATFDWMAGGSSGTIYNVTFGIKGNFAWNNTTGQPTTGGSGTSKGFTFNGSGTTASPQTLTYNGTSSTYYGGIYAITPATNTVVRLLTNCPIGASTVPYNTFTVNTGGTIDAQGFVISGGSSTANAINTGFTLGSGTELITKNTAGITSTVTIPVVNYNVNASYTFNGTATQTANFSNVTMNNLTINNSTGVTLGTATTSPIVNGTLSLTSGAFNNGSSTTAHTLTLNGPIITGTGSIVGGGTAAGSVSSLTVANTGALTGALALSGNFGNFTWSRTTGGALSGSINVDGNWSNSAGSLLDLSTNTTTINLNAAAAQTISGTNTFYNLSTGSSATSNKDFGTTTTTIAGALTFNGGVMLTTGAGNTFIFTGATGSMLGTGTKAFNNLTISSGAITNPSGGNVTISGNYVNNGTSFIQASTLSTSFGGTTQTLTGTGATTFGSVTVQGTSTVNSGTHNIGVTGTFSVSSGGTFNGGTATVAFSGTTTMGAGTGTYNFNNLTIGSGTLSNATNNKNFNVGGTWTNNGTYTSGTETISFTGTSPQTVGGTAATTFASVTVSGTGGGLSLGNSQTINGTLTLSASSGGNVDLNGSNNITLGSSATLAGETCSRQFTNSGTATQGNGYVQTTRTLAANPGNVALLGLNVQTATALGITNIKRFVQKAVSSVGLTNSIKRVYSITPTTTATGNVTLTSSYCDGELNSNTETAPTLITYYGTGTNETTGYTSFYATASNDASANTVTTAATGSLTGGVQNNITLANAGPGAYFTVQNGDWNTAATWALNSVPPAGVATTIKNVVTINGTVANAPASITIDATKSLSFGGAGIITTTTITNNGTVDMTAGGTLTIATAGTFANNSTFTGGTGTVVFAGTGSITGTTTFNNVTINNGVDFGTTSTIGATGTLQLNSGGFASNSHSPLYASGATLKYYAGGGSAAKYNQSFEWPASNGPSNVVFDNNSWVQLTGNRSLSGNLTATNGALQSLGAYSISMNGTTQTITVSNASGGAVFGTDNGIGNDLSLIISSGTTTFTGDVTTSFNDAKKFLNITVNSGATLALSRGILCKYGAFTVNGTLQINNNGFVEKDSSYGANAKSPSYNATTGALVYNNGGSYTNSEEWPAANPPFNVTVQNSSQVVLSGDRVVNGTVALTAGTIQLGANNLTIGASGTISVTSPDATKMIIANGAGQLRKAYTGNGSFLFPIGDSSANYTPATLNFTAGSYSSAYAGITITKTKQGSNASTTDYINRYWTVSTNGITSPTCTASFTYVSGDVVGTEANLYGGRYLSSTWNCLGAVNTGTHTFSSSVTAFGDFTAGESALMGCCSNPTSGGTIANTSSSVCAGNAPAAFTSTAAASGQSGTLEYKWQSSTSGAGSGFTDIVGATAATYAPGTLSVTTWFKRLSKVTCSGIWAVAGESNIIQITVNTLSVAPTGVTGTTTVCLGSGTTLTVAGGSKGTGAVTKWYTGSCGGTLVYTGDTFATGNLSSNTTYYVLYSGTCNDTSCTTVTVIATKNVWTGGAGTTSWTTAGNWSCGVPTSGSDITIDTASFYPVIASDVGINSLQVNLGATLKVTSTFDLTVTDAVVNNGTLTIENNANLIQTNNVSNTGSGSTIVKRDTDKLIRLDYVLWSSPVSGQQLQAFSPLTLSNRFYTFDGTAGAAGQYVAETATNNFVTGKGFLIRVPYNHPTTPITNLNIWNGTFTGGTAYNGTLNLTSLPSGKYYATGNPYPSTMSADQFLTDNGLLSGDGIYFWRKTNNLLQATNPSASYATYTTAGGVKSGGDTLNIIPNGSIQVGEGFIVKVPSTSLVFNNGQRTGNNSNQFLRSAALERHRIWLNLSDSVLDVNQMMVAYMTGATQDVDAAIDGRFINDSPTALNSLVNNEEFAIQGRNLPFDASDRVPLAFKAAVAGNYTIAIDHVDGLFLDGNGTQTTIYLKDNLTNTDYNLSAGAYTFASESGTFNSRFEIVYQSQLLNPTFTANTVVIYSQNNGFVINTGSISMASVKVFDIRGRLLEEKNHINASQTTIKGGLANEVLLVQITSEDGITVTKKVIR